MSEYSDPFYVTDFTTAPVNKQQSEARMNQPIPVIGDCEFQGTHFTIRTIKDLCDIPQDKLEHCLQDIFTSIQTYHFFKTVPGANVQPMEAIEWVDDGKHDIAVRIAEST